MEISRKQTLIFTYGTLKQGFANHPLLQELMRTNDSPFIGAYRTVRQLPLVCGPHGVPFLLNLPGSGRHLVRGELYSVSDRGLALIDELEGISIGHYERLPIQVRPEIEAEEGEVVEAEAYYAHRSYAVAMWRRTGREGFGAYTEAEAREYVRRVWVRGSEVHDSRAGGCSRNTEYGDQYIYKCMYVYVYVVTVAEAQRSPKGDW